MTAVWRCSDCGCTAVGGRRSHARWCLYGVTPEQEVLLLAVEPEAPARTP